MAALGRHTAAIDAAKVHELAQAFLRADFYSFDDAYSYPVLDVPSYSLTLRINGREKRVKDHEGRYVRMPAVVEDLEEEVDRVAQTSRWIGGEAGLVDALKLEGFDFNSLHAQNILKQVAARGEASTVQALLAAGVPVHPLPQPAAQGDDYESELNRVGLLTAAARHAEVLRLLVAAQASHSDTRDKDEALANAADAGNLEAVQLLIRYGANPLADFHKTRESREFEQDVLIPGKGLGTVLFHAARGGNPDVVREILSHHPKLTDRDERGATVLFPVGEWRWSNKDGARAECLRLLVKAGADVNARDAEGNTPLHTIYLTDVEAELIRLGADVNARNNDGETPLFTTVDNDAIPLLLAHGANISLRNSEGKTALEVAGQLGDTQRLQALRNALMDAHKAGERP